MMFLNMLSLIALTGFRGAKATAENFHGGNPESSLPEYLNPLVQYDHAGYDAQDRLKREEKEQDRVAATRFLKQVETLYYAGSDDEEKLDGIYDDCLVINKTNREYILPGMSCPSDDVLLESFKHSPLLEKFRKIYELLAPLNDEANRRANEESEKRRKEDTGPTMNSSWNNSTTYTTFRTEVEYKDALQTMETNYERERTRLTREFHIYRKAYQKKYPSKRTKFTRLDVIQKPLFDAKAVVDKAIEAAEIRRMESLCTTSNAVKAIDAAETRRSNQVPNPVRPVDDVINTFAPGDRVVLHGFTSQTNFVQQGFTRWNDVLADVVHVSVERHGVNKNLVLNVHPFGFSKAWYRRLGKYSPTSTTNDEYNRLIVDRDWIRQCYIDTPDSTICVDPSNARRFENLSPSYQMKAQTKPGFWKRVRGKVSTFFGRGAN